MSRTKGYKCFNIECGSCIGKTLCGEPEDTALGCVGRVIGKPMTNADRIRAMSDEELCDLLDEWWCMGANNDERLSYADERLAWLKQPSGEEDKHETD